MNEPDCVYIVDDDPPALMSVRAVLSELECEIRCYKTAEQFLGDVSIDRPGCLVTDLQMPGVTGIELQRHLARKDSPLSVVVVTGVADIPTTVTVMKQGAVILLEKPYDPDELLKMVKEALATSSVRWQIQKQQRNLRQRLSQLTDEERQIMEAMLGNRTNKSMANQLQLNMPTMDHRRSVILEKMHVKSVSELAALLSRVSPSD